MIHLLASVLIASTIATHPVACTDDHGNVVALYPCHYVVNSDGSADVYDDHA